MIEKLRRRVFFYVGEDEGVHLPTPVYESLLSVVETAEAVPELGEDNYLLMDLRAALTALHEALEEK